MRRSDDRAAARPVMAVGCGDVFEMEVKGESHYQEAIRDCVGSLDVGLTADHARSSEVDVRLVREPDNGYDSNAVSVRSMTDRTLGYLARPTAEEYAPILDGIGERAVVQCRARAYGRRAESTGHWNFGIWLDLPDATDLAEALKDISPEGMANSPGPASSIESTTGYDHADGGTQRMVAVTCPACGAAGEAAAGVGGFRCRSCQNDIWIIGCRRCHQACKIYGSAVGGGALEFRCANCRAKNTVTKQSLRAINAEVRRVDRAEAASRRAAAAAQRAGQVRRAEGREAEAARSTGRVQSEVASLTKLLESTADAPFDFNRLKIGPAKLEFLPGQLADAGQAPVLESFLPPAPRGLAAHLPGAKRKHDEQVASAKQAFAHATHEHEAKEGDRIAALGRAREEFEATVAEAEATTRQQHSDVDRLEENFTNGDPESVGEYYLAVLNAIRLPYLAPEGESRVAYSPESQQLVIEFELPAFSVVPEIREYRYIKSRDELKPSLLPAAERKRIYSSVIAQIALCVLRAAFAADAHSVVETIVFNGHVHTIDKRTGQQIHPCLLTVRATREHFDELNLALVEPAECLKGLNASVSKNPAEMVPVRPVLDFNMFDPRYVTEENVIETLDARPNLMELTPKEFESLITNLFEKMGLETRLTQPSRDGGVDCVAYDSRPIFGGKVVIQAKRSKNTVGVSAVRDLFGTMQNEGATKGILVTTSGYGQASHEFANGKPLELIDGGNLLFLLQEHAGIEAKIVVPEDWVEPDPPN